MARERRARGIAPEGEIRASHWHVVRVHLCLLAAVALVLLFFGPEALGHVRPGETPHFVRAWITIGGVGIWSIYSALAVVVNQVRLTPDRVERRSILGVRVLRRSDVVGVRQAGEEVRLCTDLKRHEGMTVPPAVLQHPVWAAWIDTLLNLDRQDLVDEQARHEVDERLGRNAQERRERLRLLGWIDGLIVLIHLAVIGWVLCWPRPYELAIVVITLLPLVVGGLLLSRHVYASHLSGAGVGLLLPPLVLAARASLDFQILDVWPPILIAGLVGLATAAISARPLKTERWLPALAIAALCGVWMAIWVWGALGFANVLLDRSKVRVVEATVLEREDQDRDAQFIVRDRGAPYEVFKGVGVTSKRVPGIKAGDRICLKIHTGRLGWRWGYVSDCSPARSL